MKRLRNQKGFTLVELIIASGLLLLVLNMVYSFLFAGQNFYSRTSDRSDKQAQLRTIMLGLKEEFKTAKGGANVAEGVPYFQLLTSGFDTVTLTGDQRMYYFEDGKFWTRNAGGAARPAYVDFDLPNLTVEFSTVVGNDRVIEVKLASNEFNLTEIIALNNVNISSDGDYNDEFDPQIYYGVVLEPLLVR